MILTEQTGGRVLIVEDDADIADVLRRSLRNEGYEVRTSVDGVEALDVAAGFIPDLVVLDLGLPGMDGVEVCRRLRQCPAAAAVYVILLTARSAKTDVVAGLKAGANDYITKPFNLAELEARVHVGRTVVELQARLAARVSELEAALAQVNQLRGLLPICSYCRKVRDDHDYWHQVETYIARHSEVQFSHGICPDCWQRQVAPQLRHLGLGCPDNPASPSP